MHIVLFSQIKNTLPSTRHNLDLRGKRVKNDSHTTNFKHRSPVFKTRHWYYSLTEHLTGHFRCDGQVPRTPDTVGPCTTHTRIGGNHDFTSPPKPLYHTGRVPGVASVLNKSVQETPFHVQQVLRFQGPPLRGTRDSSRKNLKTHRVFLP